MIESSGIYGLMVAFDQADQAQVAAQSLYDKGYRALEAFTPFPIEQMPASLGYPSSPLPKFIFLGGLLGGISGYALQYWTSVMAYPLVIGGRPLHSAIAFIPIAFETTILGAALTAVFAMLFANRLPRLHHPLFNVPEFERASVDRFFVCVLAEDPAFIYEKTRQDLHQYQGLGVYDVMF